MDAKANVVARCPQAGPGGIGVEPGEQAGDLGTVASVVAAEDGAMPECVAKVAVGEAAKGVLAAQ